MARPIILSNGEMAIGLNRFGMVHDLYFPYVGLENHSSERATRHRIGLFVNDAVHWLSDGTWKVQQSYLPGRLIGKTVATNEWLGFVIEFQDFVDSELNVLARNIEVINLHDNERKVKLYLHQAFIIGESADGHDTAQYLPESDNEAAAILHYKGRRAFTVSGYNPQTGEPFDSFSIGHFGNLSGEHHDGVWRDAEDGELSRNPVERIQTDSILQFDLQMAAHDSARVHYFLAAGKSIAESRHVLEKFRADGLLKRILKTDAHWKQWLAPAVAVAEVKVAPEFRANFLNSLMILKSMMDRRGAIMASLDTEMLKYTRDAYVDCWPRDASYVMMAFWKIGYIDEVKQFLRFAKDTLSEEGFFWQMYRPDASIGPNSHAYIHDGEVAPPIQTDETATTLFLLSKVMKLDIERGGRLEDWREFYEELGRPAANFLANYVDPSTGLPKPSYELWEVLYQTTTYTTAATFGALNAAADMAQLFGETNNVEKWRSVAATMRDKADILWNHERNYFYRGFWRHHDGNFDYDATIDVSAFYGAWVFNLFDADKIQTAFLALSERFGVNNENVKIPRFEGDDYNRANPDSDGNPWFITSFWLAQYQSLQFQKGRDSAETQFTQKVLDWANEQMNRTVILPEQINPENGDMLSAAPLAWSHAEFVNTCLAYGNKRDEGNSR